MTKAKHSVLDLHDNIGWDVDETLINGRNSVFWRAYVASHPEKVHHIITFRCKRDAECVYSELEKEYVYPLSSDKFVDLHYLPKYISDSFDKLHPHLIDFNHRKCLPTNKVERILKREGLTLEELIDIKESLYNWKANKCKELGLTALVDDLEKVVKQGCEVNGVTFINSIK